MAGRLSDTSGRPAAAPADREDLPRIPHGLRLERVPAAWAKRAAAVSLATLPVTIGLGGSLWLIWLALLAPWVPIVVKESRYKLTRDAVFASFGLMVILQVLHMVERSTQIVQLAITGATLADSHGVIGQLDFETVHFVADTALWFSLGLMAVIFRGRNVWLWVAFAAASLHEVEHLYLFLMYVFEDAARGAGCRRAPRCTVRRAFDALADRRVPWAPTLTMQQSSPRSRRACASTGR